MKQRGSASMRRGLLGAKLKLSNITSCIILLKGQLHARRALSKRERGASPSYVKGVGKRRQGPRRKSGAALDEETIAETCEESILNVRKGCVSLYVKIVGYSEGEALGQSRKQPSTRKSRKSENANKLTEVLQREVMKRGWGWERENGGALRRQRCVRKRFCGDGVCVPGWPTVGVTSAAFLSINKSFSPAAARPDFRSSSSPPRS
eukprot:2523121-Pleurochrysis_carterae.AAC.1